MDNESLEPSPGFAAKMINGDGFVGFIFISCSEADFVTLSNLIDNSSAVRNNSFWPLWFELVKYEIRKISAINQSTEYIISYISGRMLVNFYHNCSNIQFHLVSHDYERLVHCSCDSKAESNHRDNSTTSLSPTAESTHIHTGRRFAMIHTSVNDIILVLNSYYHRYMDPISYVLELAQYKFLRLSNKSLVGAFKHIIST